MDIEQIEDLDLKAGDDVVTKKGIVVGSVLKWDKEGELHSGWFDRKITLTNHTTLQNVDLYVEDFLLMLQSGIYKVVKG